MAVRRSDLGAVGVVVHRGQRMQEAPDTGTEEGHDRRTQRPQHCHLVGVLAAPAVDHVKGEHRHHEERERLKRREDRSPPLPVFRGADPEIMVTGTDNAADQGHGDNDIHPFLDNLAVDTGHLDQHKGQDRSHDQFPDTFHP